MSKTQTYLFFIFLYNSITITKGNINNNTLTFYKIINKRYNDVNFDISYLSNDTYINLDFGKKFTLEPIDYHCKSEFEKENVRLCMRDNPELVWNWNCIYEYCVSIGISQPMYFYIQI